MVRVRSEFLYGYILEVFLARYSPGGSDRLWIINLLKNEPLRTTKSITKLFCDSR